MKITGLIFIFAAFSATGFYFSEKYISLLNDIKRADLFLKNLIFGIKCEHMTVYEIFKEIIKNCDKKTKNFLSDISPENFEKISEYSEKSGFCKNKTANSILEEAFFVLGKYSASEQEPELEFCRGKLKALYEKNEHDFLSKAKLSKSFGILSGLFAVIVLF